MDPFGMTKQVKICAHISISSTWTLRDTSKTALEPLNPIPKKQGNTALEQRFAALRTNGTVVTWGRRSCALGCFC